VSWEMAVLVAEEFNLDDKTRKLLIKNIRKLNRAERKYYFESIKPMERDIKEFLSWYYSDVDVFTREQVELQTVNSLLEKRGDPDLVDSMVMDVVGRIKVYKALREKTEREGGRLSILTNFGGVSMVVFAVVVITAVILYLSNI